MATFFISDLHLDESRPAATEAFLRFTCEEARSADAVYILGDLFEAWLGDGDPAPLNQQVIEALAALTNAGIPCFLMHGNRDFLIGEDFCSATGVRLLADPTLAWIHGTSLLLSHGDLLCTDDVGYQRYRRIIRNPAAGGLLNALPAAIRHGIMKYIRARSAAKTGMKAPEITDVNQAAVEATLREYQVSTLLHGHTHRPAIHDFPLNGSQGKRIVLGDWYEQGSVLKWDENGPRLTGLEYNAN